MSRIKSTSSHKYTITIVLPGNVPNQAGKSVQHNHYSLFTHSDGRSPNIYCLYKHPITGKQAHFSCRTSDPNKALDYVAERLPEVLKEAYEKAYSTPSSGPNPAKAQRPAFVPILLSAFATRYVDERRTRRGRPLRKPSRDAILDGFNQFVKRIGDKHIHLITEAECRDFISTGQPSDRTAQKHCVNLRTAFRDAVRRGWIKENYFEGIVPPVPQYTDEQLDARCFAEDKFEFFYKNLPHRTYAQRRLRNKVLLAHETGLRLSELRNIRDVNVDLADRILEVKSAGDDLLKTSASSRVIPLTPNAIDAIQAQQTEKAAHPSQEIRESKYLFPDKFGKALTRDSAERQFGRERNRILGKGGGTLHGLRHSLVTRMSLSGKATDRQIQEITGHSSLAMVKHYSHMKRRLSKQALDAMSDGPRYDVITGPEPTS